MAPSAIGGRIDQNVKPRRPAVVQGGQSAAAIVARAVSRVSMRALFERVYKELLPHLMARWEQRQKRPVPAAIEVARGHFTQIWAVDGSTLEALFRKIGSLEDRLTGTLAGKMCLVIDLMRQLPVELWFSEAAQAFDTNFLPNVLALIGEKTLLILDRGFYDFTFFAQVMDKGAHFITRLKSNAKLRVIQRLTTTDAVRDLIIWLGTGQNGAPILQVRIVEVRFGLTWYRYVTSVLDPAVLPPFVVADLCHFTVSFVGHRYSNSPDADLQHSHGDIGAALLWQRRAFPTADATLRWPERDTVCHRGVYTGTGRALYTVAPARTKCH